MWFAAEGDRLLVMTDPNSGKVKRIEAVTLRVYHPTERTGYRTATA